MLYRVTVGRDEYLGDADEIVAFMATAEGAPASTPTAFMAGVARRLRDQMGVTGIATDDTDAFLLALSEQRLIRLENASEPLSERVDMETALGDGPVVYGEGVEPDDVPE